MSDSDYAKQRREFRRAQRYYDNMSEPIPDDTIECGWCGEPFVARENEEICPHCDTRAIRKCSECQTWRPEKDFPSKEEPSVCKYCL